MKALITGSEGFVGRHLSAELESNGYDVIRCSLEGGDGYVGLNILDFDAVKKVLSDYMPDVIVNMAGQANVALSWKKPQFTMTLNVNGFVNILDAVREVKPDTKIIGIGSADEYGSLGSKGNNVTEDTSVNPMTPYAVSKVAQENMAMTYCRAYGMNINMIRFFNMGGAGQAKGFMISDFASGIADIEAGKSDCLLVGNLESARDFTHVKDAVRACRLIIEKGIPGEIYNVCSGRTYTAQEVLNRLCSMAKCGITIKQDASRMRPSDTPVVCGNHDKLTAHTGWQPEKSIDEILSEALSQARQNP